MINLHSNQLWSKKDDIWFTLKSCSCGQKARKKIFKVTIVLMSYQVIKVFILANIVKLRSNVGVSKTL